MALAILLANKNTNGSGLTPGVNAADSGNIVTQGTSGGKKQRLTYGAQAQATQPLQCAPNSNYVSSSSGPGGAGTPNAAITNSTITSSFVNGLPVVTVTCTAVNSFAVGQTVGFTGLTNASAINNFAGVVQAAGLSGTAFTVIMTNWVPIASGVLPTASSAPDSGTAKVVYFSREACLSADAEKE